MNESADLFRNVAGTLVAARPYPESPGWKRDGTSHQAARSVATLAPTLRDRVLAALRQRPSTADEIAGLLGESILSIRPRLSELVKLAKIGETAERRRNSSGKLAAVWRVKENGAPDIAADRPENTQPIQGVNTANG